MIMVTGGAGYVGSQLVPALLESGFKVKVVDNLMFGNHGLVPYMKRIELEQTDIRQLRPEHFRGVDTVIHLAGISNDPTAEYDPQTNKAVNFKATVKLGKLAKACGVRKFIFASSCSVYYTEKPDNFLRDEMYPVDPKTPYSWSKRQAEIQLLNLADADFCPVLLRKGTIFGYSERMRFDLVINTFTRDAYAIGCMTVHGEGRMWRPMLHIEDAVETYKAILTKPEAAIRGQIFNVLNDNYQVLEIAEEVQKILKEKLRIKLNIIREGNVRSYRVDGSKLKETLGLKPNNSIKTAVETMWNLLEKKIDFNNDIYYNIRWLKSLYERKYTKILTS